MYACACICVYVYVCMCVLFVYVYVCMHRYVCIYMHVGMCMMDVHVLCICIYKYNAYAYFIGVGRFIILGGGQGLEFWVGQGGANSQQAQDVGTTSMRRNDVASTSFRRRVPIRFSINQCQIITFLILKYDIIENSRIELRGIVLPVQMGGLLGSQRVCWPPSQIIGGGPGLPSSYAYVFFSLSLNS